MTPRPTISIRRSLARMSLTWKSSIRLPYALEQRHRVRAAERRPVEVELEDDVAPVGVRHQEVEHRPVVETCSNSQLWLWTISVWPALRACSPISLRYFA